MFVDGGVSPFIRPHYAAKRATSEKRHCCRTDKIRASFSLYQKDNLSQWEQHGQSSPGQVTTSYERFEAGTHWQLRMYMDSGASLTASPPGAHRLLSFAKPTEL